MFILCYVVHYGVGETKSSESRLVVVNCCTVGVIWCYDANHHHIPDLFWRFARSQQRQLMMSR